MSEMIERVARAIEAEFLRIGEDGSEYASGGDRGLILDGMFDLTSIARAAIEAMREPTEAMQRYVDEAVFPPDCWDDWRLLIDAALRSP